MKKINKLINKFIWPVVFVSLLLNAYFLGRQWWNVRDKAGKDGAAASKEMVVVRLNNGLMI